MDLKEAQKFAYNYVTREDFLLMDKFMCGGFTKAPLPDIKVIITEALKNLMEKYKLELKTIQRKELQKDFERSVVKLSKGIFIESVCVYDWLDVCIDLVLFIQKNGIERKLVFDESDHENHGTKRLTEIAESDLDNIFVQLGVKK